LHDGTRTVTMDLAQEPITLGSRLWWFIPFIIIYASCIVGLVNQSAVDDGCNFMTSS